MSEIEDAISSGAYVVSFADAAATERALVGGKGSNLTRLAAGLPVPAGFCVTTAAYEALIAEPIQKAIDEPEINPTDTMAIAEMGAALRA